MRKGYLLFILLVATLTACTHLSTQEDSSLLADKSTKEKIQLSTHCRELRREMQLAYLNYQPNDTGWQRKNRETQFLREYKSKGCEELG